MPRRSGLKGGRIEIDGEGTFKTWCHWRVAWGCAPGSSAAPPLTPAPVPVVRPVTIISDRAREVRRRLISMVERFKIQQCHIYNRKQALENVERRNATPFNTRGQF